MSEKIGKLKTLLLILIVVELLGLVSLHFLFDLDIKLAALYFIINTLTVYFLVQYFQEDSQNRMFGVSRILGSEAKDAFQFGQNGILTYAKNYMITWMSELFADRGINRISKKLTMWLPEVNGGWLLEELDTVQDRTWEKYQPLSREEKELAKEIYAYWQGRTLADQWRALVPG